RHAIKSTRKFSCRRFTGDMNSTSPSTHSHRCPSSPAARNSSQVMVVPARIRSAFPSESMPQARANRTKRVWSSLVRCQLCLNAVANPVRVPPLDGAHRNAVEQDREVQVVAAGESRLAAAPDYLRSLHRIARLDVDRAQEAVERLQAAAVVEDDGVP